MTTKSEISQWFDRGVAQGAKFMIVLCDTFDYDDYPSYHSTQSDAESEIKHPGHMQKVMEVYDLTADRDQQLDKQRCYALPIH